MPLINDDTAQFKLPKKLKRDGKARARKLKKSWSAHLRELLRIDLQKAK